jgi:glutamate-1-semialdehyde 2,1-aminomutase
VKCDPPVIASGKGAYMTDVDGNKYIDLVLSWGPLILGHAPKSVTDATVKAARAGASFGAPTALEMQMGRLVKDMVPSIELVRFVNSGTEATMSALRVARGFTKRDKIVKFEGCYHGHADGLLVKAGSGALTLGEPSSPGVPASYAQQTLTAQFNDLASVEKLFKANKNKIAAVIVEPVVGNMGCVPPAKGFLQGLRRLTAANGALLIFDEVMTGFRVAPGGAQQLYKIKPDLSCFGKVIGGGLPVGAYGGRGDVMSLVSPLGPVYQAGTLSGNPLAMAAGLETLKALRSKKVYEKLEALGEQMETGLLAAAKAAGIPAAVNRVGSMMTLFFTKGKVRDYATAVRSDTDRFARFFQGMLRRGVYLPCSQFEAFFLSAAHTPQDIARVVAAAGEVFREI